MGTKKQKPLTKIEVCEEPEIQFLIPNAELGESIKEWLIDRGALDKKAVRDSAVYWDTEKFDLLAEGLEYRIKEKGDQFRHDMKAPLDTHGREVIPDEHDILWRNEFKFKTKNAKPSLAAFFGQALLEPVIERVRDFFDKKLKPVFRSSFFKHKYDIDVAPDHDSGHSRIEYSFQTGHMEKMRGDGKTPLLRILELELRDGDQAALLAEKAAVQAKFGPKGLVLLPERKILLGFSLLEPGMTRVQRRVYEDVLSRSLPEEAGITAPPRLIAAG